MKSVNRSRFAGDVHHPSINPVLHRLLWRVQLFGKLSHAQPLAAQPHLQINHILYLTTNSSACRLAQPLLGTILSRQFSPHSPTPRLAPTPRHPSPPPVTPAHDAHCIAQAQAVRSSLREIEGRTDSRSGAKVSHRILPFPPPPIAPVRHSRARRPLHSPGPGCPFVLREIEGRTDSRSGAQGLPSNIALSPATHRPRPSLPPKSGRFKFRTCPRSPPGTGNAAASAPGPPRFQCRRKTKPCSHLSPWRRPQTAPDALDS